MTEEEEDKLNAAIEEAVQRYADLVALRVSIEKFFKDVRPQDDRRREDDLRREVQQLQDELASMEDEIQERHPEALSDLMSVRKDLEVAAKSIKKLVRRLPPDRVERAGFSIKKDYDGFAPIKVTISRAETKTDYKVSALLKAYPALHGVTLDGDPVVVTTIDHAVMERLLSSGSVDRDIVEKYRRKRFVRAPSTTIRELSEDES